MTAVVGTTLAAGTVVLAHHPLVAALPFVVPTVLITLIVVVMVIRDRRREPRE